MATEAEDKLECNTLVLSRISRHALKARPSWRTQLANNLLKMRVIGKENKVPSSAHEEICCRGNNRFKVNSERTS
jgi:hypothetical protein